MLKSNSKQAKENIKNYIINNFDFSNYETEETAAPETYNEICKCIFETMKKEKSFCNYVNDSAAFKDWCQGLPSIFDTCYYYNRYAKDDLKIILEETEEEANKFTEEQAEEMLTELLFREIKNNM